MSCVVSLPMSFLVSLPMSCAFAYVLRCIFAGVLCCIFACYISCLFIAEPRGVVSAGADLLREQMRIQDPEEAALDAPGPRVLQEAGPLQVLPKGIRLRHRAGKLTSISHLYT